MRATHRRFRRSWSCRTSSVFDAWAEFRLLSIISCLGRRAAEICDGMCSACGTEGAMPAYAREGRPFCAKSAYQGWWISNELRRGWSGYFLNIGSRMPGGLQLVA